MKPGPPSGGGSSRRVEQIFLTPTQAAASSSEAPFGQGDRELATARLGQVRQRQTQLAGTESEHLDCSLDRGRIVLEKHGAAEIEQTMMDFPAGAVFAAEQCRYKFSDRIRHDVGDDRDHPVTADAHDRKRERIVTRKDREIVGRPDCDLTDLIERTARFFDTRNRRDFVGQAQNRFRSQVHPSPAGHVVEDEREIGCIGDRREVTVHPFLGRLVVIGHDDQRRIGARPRGVERVLDRTLGVVRAGSRDDRDAAADLADHSVHHAVVLRNRHRGRFAGGSAGHQSADAALDLKVDQTAQSGLIDLAIAKRGNKRRVAAGKTRVQLDIHGVSPFNA